MLVKINLNKLLISHLVHTGILIHVGINSVFSFFVVRFLSARGNGNFPKFYIFETGNREILSVIKLM